MPAERQNQPMTTRWRAAILWVGAALSVFGGIIILLGYLFSSIDCGGCSRHIETGTLPWLWVGLAVLVIGLLARRWRPNNLSTEAT